MTKEQFLEIMKDHLTGVGNEWDEEEDLDSFMKVFESVWADIVKKFPEITRFLNLYQVVCSSISGNPARQHHYKTREDLIESLDNPENWDGVVIEAIFDSSGQDIKEELDSHIHDENHEN